MPEETLTGATAQAQQIPADNPLVAGFFLKETETRGTALRTTW